MKIPWNTQKHRQSHYAVQNNIQSGCHQSRYLYLSSDITHRTSHSLQYQTFSTSTDLFKFSIFPHTVVFWNALPPDILCFSFGSTQITDPNPLQLNIKQFLFCIYVNALLFFFFKWLNCKYGLFTSMHSCHNWRNIV